MRYYRCFSLFHLLEHFLFISQVSSFKRDICCISASYPASITLIRVSLHKPNSFSSMAAPYVCCSCYNFQAECDYSAQSLCPCQRGRKLFLSALICLEVEWLEICPTARLGLPTKTYRKLHLCYFFHNSESKECTLPRLFPTALIEYQVKGVSLMERFLHGVYSPDPMIEECYHSYEYEIYWHLLMILWFLTQENISLLFLFFDLH